MNYSGSTEFASDDRVIRAGLVLSGKNFDPIVDGAVVVRDKKIIWVGSAQVAPAADFHFPDLTLAPGLIDAHVHLFDPKGLGTDHEPSEAEKVLAMVGNLSKFLSAGVTTIRDLGSPGTLGSEIRDAVDSGKIVGPRMVVANRCLTITGGHGYQFGIECDSEEELRKAVRQLLKDGSDCVKIMASGGFVHHRRSEGGSLYFPLFTFSEMKAIVDEAHKNGMHVAAHAQNKDAIEMAFETGVDTLEHCTFTAKPTATLDEDLVKRIAASGRPVIPTVNNYWLTVGVPWAEKEIALGNLRRLYDLGVNMIAGTDSGIPTTTPDLYAEGLRVFHEVGIAPDYILRSATTAAAAAIGLADVTGSIEPGLSADLVGFGGNPLEEIDAYFRPRAVFARGQLISAVA